MNADEDLRRAVVDALRREPGLYASGIVVGADRGVVTLTGTAPAGVRVHKFIAERVVKGVDGVRAVVNDVGVDTPADGRRPDPEIASEVLEALRWDAAVPDHRVRAVVRDGWIVLEGTVDRPDQRDAAGRAVRRLIGPRGVTNNLLVAAARPAGPPAADPCREVAIPAGRVTVRGTLRWAGEPRGVVVFAHGSGSSRHSPRNQFVARVLNGAGFATLLLDLLTGDEAADRDKVFDCPLLADRLAAAAAWAAGEPELAGLPVGYFGASTGSAAALLAAASHPRRVAAVVSRGGRPDLARDELPAVRAPTLLIVGGDDEPVLGWNRDAAERLRCPHELAVVPGATHLFEEPGALEQVAGLARDWFDCYLARRTAPAGFAAG